MARTVLEQRRDGTYAIRRVGRWRWAWVTIACVCAVLPFALSLVLVLPAIVLALPPMILGLGTWMLFRRLVPPEPPRPPLRRDRAHVVPLSRKRGTSRHPTATTWSQIAPMRRGTGRDR